MNEFNAVSMDELTKVEGGSLLDTFVNAALAVGTVACPLGRIAAEVIVDKAGLAK